VQVSDATHRQARQVGHGDLKGVCDGDGQHTDRGRLVDHDEYSAVRRKAGEDLGQRGVVGVQRLEPASPHRA
jgi:hypothetical protein